jgi:large exoprotein involved in heme utilization and adhesion
VTPVDATDYIYSGVPSTDLSLTFTNYNSAGEYDITNNGSTDVTFTTLQVRGKPVYLYDKVTLVSTDAGMTWAVPLDIRMKYQDDVDFANDVKNYLAGKYSTYPTNNVSRSISFIATADSDTMSLAMNGKLGKSVNIIEDVNVISDPYIITQVGWDIYAPELIQVTWDLWPADRWANYFLHDSDDTASYMTDSDSNRFAFWR